MYVNPLLVPMLILALTAFFLGGWVIRRVESPAGRVAILMAASLLSLPGLLFTLYYTHRFDDAQWFYEFRTLPYTELSAAGLGFLAGMLAALLVKDRRLLVLASRTTTAGTLVLWLLVPYIKSLFWPTTPAGFHDEWHDGVCIQSIGSSCGPAAAATLLHAAGIPVTEAALARDSFTSLSGTEVWYLARALRKRGFTTRYRFTPPNPENLPTPALAGTCLGGPGGSGHFIALLAPTPTGYHVGDSLVGPVALPAHDYRPYHFTGFFLLVERQ